MADTPKTDAPALLAESENLPETPIGRPTDDDRVADAVQTPDDADALTGRASLSSWQSQQGKQTPEVVAAEFLALIEQGLTYREASIRVGINLRTGYRLLARCDADVEALQAATRKILAQESLDRIEDWRVAARVGAAKRGNHLPAKDWLLHAGVIEPMSSENGGGIRIAINIGTDEKPMQIPSPLHDIEVTKDH